MADLLLDPSVVSAWVFAEGPVLAHQGGWDEILLVLAPLLVIGGLLWLANKRANKRTRLEPPPET